MALGFRALLMQCAPAQLCLGLALCLLAVCSQGADETRILRDRDGRSLELQLSDQFEAGQADNVVRWIRTISGSLRDVYGHWPRQHWQVRIEPVSGSAEDPIPWAQVHRDTVDTVEFFILANATTGQLEQAWTGYHELAHLLIPYRGWGDAWFSEGLASYYQNLMQARAGILSDQQMWQRLYAGFERGRADNHFDGKPLHAVSAGLRQHGGFMRVYWSGAWYFLNADLQLRRESGGRLTLDSALARLNHCCGEQSLSVPEMVRKLDQLNDTRLFDALYQQAVAATTMPAFEPLLAQLSIEVLDGQVILREVGPGAALRRTITSPATL